MAIPARVLIPQRADLPNYCGRISSGSPPLSVIVYQLFNSSIEAQFETPTPLLPLTTVSLAEKSHQLFLEHEISDLTHLAIILAHESSLITEDIHSTTNIH